MNLRMRGIGFESSKIKQALNPEYMLSTSLVKETLRAREITDRMKNKALSYEIEELRDFYLNVKISQGKQSVYCVSDV